MKKVLILMSDTGGGHRASAEAVRDAFHERYGGWFQVDMVDLMIPHLYEELDELADAMKRRDGENVGEELGDLIFNLVFVARLAKEEGWFTIEESLAGIRDKIVRRHPHVFGDANCDTANEVLEQWNRIKDEEKG